MSGKGYTLIGPLCYRGKVGCTNPLCTTKGDPDRCYGWHCSYCDEPCSCQGHGCDIAKTLLGAAQREANP